MTRCTCKCAAYPLGRRRPHPPENFDTCVDFEQIRILESVYPGQVYIHLLAARPATPLMTPTTALGLFIRLSMFDLRETGDWDIWHPLTVI